jgi:hypothetical protein
MCRLSSISPLVVLALLTAACAGAPTSSGSLERTQSPPADPVWGAPGRTIAAHPGQPLAIELGTVGPGQFAAPPAVSSGAIQFVSAADACPCVPAGERQLFQFVVTRLGTAIVTFQHQGSAIPGGDQPVTDTIVVR